MGFLIAFVMAGNYWQANVFCQKPDHCSISYTIAPPMASGTTPKDCSGFKVISQTPLSDQKKTVDMVCQISKNPKQPTHSFVSLTAKIHS